MDKMQIFWALTESKDGPDATLSEDIRWPGSLDLRNEKNSHISDSGD